MKNLLLAFFLLSRFQTQVNEKLLNVPGYDTQSFFRQKFYDLTATTSDFNTVVSAEHFDLHCMNAAIFEATNRLRTAKRKPALKFDSQLRDAATYHSYKMVTQNFFSHTNTREPALRTSLKRMQYFGFSGRGYGENCDLNYVEVEKEETYEQVAARIVDALYHSKEHRENILSKQFTHLGCGAFTEPRLKDGVLVIKATQCFGAK